METLRDTPPEQSLIEYPCRFPIKVMGLNTPEFFDAMVGIASTFEVGFDAASCVQRRASRAGKFLSLTVSVFVVDRAQLDNVYRALTSHPLVRYVL